MGSVTEKVLRIATVPLLVTRSVASEKAKPAKASVVRVRK
jgi:hypothetical protein